MTKERRLYVKVMYIYDSTSQKSGNEMLQAKVVVKNVFNVHFFFQKILLCMWKNMVKPDRPQITI